MEADYKLKGERPRHFEAVRRTVRTIIPSISAFDVELDSRGMLAFEEPENGVHPRRVELIAKMLTSLALDHRRQVVVTTHSPLFCDAVLKEARSRSTDDIGLFNVRRDGAGSTIEPFETHGPLFDDPEITEALSDAD